MNKTIGSVTVISDKEFEALFNDPDLGDWKIVIEDTYACTCRTLELLNMWKRHLAFSDILSEMWEICFDLYSKGDILYMPMSFYNFCVETLTAIEDTIEE